MENNVDSKYKIIALILILIILIIGVNILKNIKTKDEIWNYDEITSITDVISYGSVTDDRKTYYELEDIIIRFLLSNDITTNNLDTENIGYQTSYKEYYSILTPEYKKHLSKAKFTEKASVFINKFIKEIDMEKYKVVETRDIIDVIYEYEDNKYLCVLTANAGMAYIGIKLNTDGQTYNIFYIE